MAAPVEFRTYTPVNSREDLMRRLEAAPLEHADALLELWEIVGKLHDTGMLDIAKGLLEAGDAVIGHVTDLVSSKQAIAATRGGLLLLNVLAAVDTDKLRAVMLRKDTPSPYEITKTALSADSRRAIATGLGVLQVFGAALRESDKG